MIRKATAADIESAAEIYAKIHTEEEQGRMQIGWDRAIYPTKQTAVDAVERGDLFVEEADGKIVAAAILNQIQVPEYADCSWEFDAEDDEVMVLHTLVVNPEQSGHGYAGAFIRYYQEYALANGCHYLRIDTNAKNQTARKMYAKYGFKEPGIVDCVFNGIAGVKLVCLEKKI
ncbi:MAG: GNAT family N-acetyltransferase [Eubacteriales bacterium]|nr:GNAT family N-acetyltransferase [Eubacteriales bacterium]